MVDTGIINDRVLIVDDEDMILLAIEATLQISGYENITTCNDSRNVLSLMEELPVQAVLLDLNMPHMNGEELLSVLQEKYPGVPVIVITGAVEVDTAVRCMQNGAFDYILKPVKDERLLASVKKALTFGDLARENQSLKEQILSNTLENPEAFSSIITSSRNMMQLFEYVEAISVSSQPVLITGETGVGKELFAKAVHKLSGIPGKSVSVNVAGLDDTVFSDTLFGHVRGAFTGAEKIRKGLLAEAAGSTVFLDEIGDLSTMSQVKLLRLLQENEYFPLGADVPRKSTARIITATNRDLKQLVKENKFRQDLYYRLMIHNIHIPPLRKRRKDIPLLLECFFEEAAENMKKKIPTWPPELEGLLSSYHFPGNVRELQAMVFDAVSRHTSKVLSMSSFSRHIEGEIRETEHVGSGFSDPLPTIKDSTEMLIAEAMKRSNGVQTVAARMLGISHQALSRRLKNNS